MNKQLGELVRRATLDGRIDLDIWREIVCAAHFLNRMVTPKDRELREKMNALAEASSQMFEAFQEVEAALKGCERRMMP